MAFRLGKKFDKTEGDYIYAFDLDIVRHMGSRYVVTVGVDLEGLSHSEVEKKLRAKDDYIHPKSDKNEAIDTVHNFFQRR